MSPILGLSLSFPVSLSLSLYLALVHCLSLLLPFSLPFSLSLSMNLLRLEKELVFFRRVVILNQISANNSEEEEGET